MLNLKIVGAAQENSQLTWITTTRCNFNCEYCEKSPAQDTDWNYIKELNTCIHYLILTGGECTLYKDLDKIVEHSNIKMKIWSNLTADIKYYMYLLDLNPLVQEIFTSFHPAFTNYESWIEKVHILSKRVKMFANVMYEKKDNIDIKSVRKYCSANYGYIVGSDYYSTQPDMKLFDNEYYCSINNIPFYFQDRKNLVYKTKAVKCDINKKRLNLIINKYKICNFQFNNIKEALDYNILCSNQLCTTMFLRRGNKSGLFESVKNSIVF